MNTKAKILIAEHDENDIELLEYELKKGGINFVSQIVQNEKEFGNAIKSFDPDIILSDYSFPSFDGPAAFKIREDLAPDTPFIFVSGSIGEENSIEFIKKGVTDYVLKDKLFTLNTKVKRALKESKEKQQKDKTEKELLQSEQRLARAQQVAQMGSWEIDMLTNIQTWSEGMYEIFGIDRNVEPSTALFLSLIHPDDLAHSIAHVEKAYTTLTDGFFNFRFTRNDGEVRYCYTEYRLGFDRDIKPVRLYGIVQDISEKQKAEESLRQSENRFRSLIEKSVDMILLRSPEGKILYASPSVTTVLGYTNEELLGNSPLNFIHPDDIPGLVQETQSILGIPGGFFHRQQRCRHKNGNWIWAEGTLTNMLHEPGINAFVSNFRDISEKKLTEREREFDNNNLNALINNTSDLMWSVDLAFKLITSNQPFNKLVKIMSGNTITKGANILSLGFSPQQLNRFKVNYERAFAGESFSDIEYTPIPVESWSEISYCPIRKGDEVVGTACHSHDITERKLAEEERTKITNDLMRHNKDLEQFAYIISHNLRAPVANIIGIADAVHSGKLRKEQDKQMMGHLITSVKKLDEVIKDLNHILQVKHDVSEKKEIVRFNTLLANIQLSIDSLIAKENVKFITNFTEADEMQTIKSYLHSIFFNLISNSIKYRSPLVAPVIEITSKKTENKILLTFKDNGLGIDLEKRRKQIFGLYKRFHLNTEGKGMGLYMVKAQVETLGGTISVFSEVNKGAEFRIEFNRE